MNYGLALIMQILPRSRHFLFRDAMQRHENRGKGRLYFRVLREFCMGPDHGNSLTARRCCPNGPFCLPFLVVHSRIFVHMNSGLALKQFRKKEGTNSSPKDRNFRSPKIPKTRRHFQFQIFSPYIGFDLLIPKVLEVRERSI